MAFQNVVMPQIKLIHGVQKTVIDPVTIIGNGARETRRKQNRYERFSWNYPSRSILAESKQELHEFFAGMGSSLDSFLMIDPDFPDFAGMQLTEFAAPNWYFETPTGHPYFNPVMSGLTFKVNGVTKTATFFNGDDNGALGRPYVSVANSLPGDIVTVSGPAHLTVRLNGTLAWNISAMVKNGTCSPTPTIVDMSDLSLVEVFEYA